MNAAAATWRSRRSQARGQAARLAFLFGLLAVVLTVRPSLGLTAEPAQTEGLDLKGRLELFVDRFLIERLEGAELRLHEPTATDVAIRYDEPWEGAFCGYVTVLQDGGLPVNGLARVESRRLVFRDALIAPDFIGGEVPENVVEGVVIGGGR